MRKIGHLVSGVALTAMLGACASTTAQLHTAEATSIAGDLKRTAAEPAAPANVSSVQVNPAAYVSTEVYHDDHGDPLPGKWQSGNVDFARAGAASFQDVASAITKATGIPVAVATAPSAQQTNVSSRTGSADSTGGTIGGTPDQQVSQALQALAGSGTPQQPTIQTVSSVGGADVGISGTMRLNYTGKLGGFLDLVSSNFNIAWEYRNGRILFSKTLTRVFDVPALAVVENLSFQMQSTAGGNTSSDNGARAGQVASTQGTYNLWDELNNALGGMIGPPGVYKMSPQTGQVIVMAPPSTIETVSAYLKQLNAKLSKQVAISVNVYSVAVGDDDDYSANVTALFPNAGAFGLSFTGSGPATGGGLGWAVINGAMSGSNGILKALSSRHDVSTVTSASVTALNGIPVPVQVANTQAYAKSVSVTTDAQGGQTGSVEPGEVTTGFNLHLVPKILGDGKVLLQYGMNLSELNTITDFAVPGGGSIQLPNVTQRNFIQQAQIPSGDTLVLAGYEQVRAEDSSNGPGHSGLWFLGGERKGSMAHNIIVIAITPVVLDVSNTAQATYSGR